MAKTIIQENPKSIPDAILKVVFTRNLVDMKFGLGHSIIAAFHCITLQFGYIHMFFAGRKWFGVMPSQGIKEHVGPESFQVASIRPGDIPKHLHNTGPTFGC